MKRNEKEAIDRYRSLYVACYFFVGHKKVPGVEPPPPHTHTVGAGVQIRGELIHAGCDLHGVIVAETLCNNSTITYPPRTVLLLVLGEPLFQALPFGGHTAFSQASCMTGAMNSLCDKSSS